jgi:hypothetical protein
MRMRFKEPLKALVGGSVVTSVLNGSLNLILI